MQAVRSGGVGFEGVRGYDPPDRTVGRKRHALTDTGDSLLMVVASPDDLHDSHGGVALLRVHRQLWPFLAPSSWLQVCEQEKPRRYPPLARRWLGEAGGLYLPPSYDNIPRRGAFPPIAVREVVIGRCPQLRSRFMPMTRTPTHLPGG